MTKGSVTMCATHSMRTDLASTMLTMDEGGRKEASSLQWACWGCCWHACDGEGVRGWDLLTGHWHLWHLCWHPRHFVPRYQKQLHGLLVLPAHPISLTRF